MVVKGEEKFEDSKTADSESESVSLESSFFVANDTKKKKILYVTTISGFLPQFEDNDVSIMQECGYEIHYASNFNNSVYSIPKDYFKEKGVVCHHINIAKSPFRFFTNLKSIKELKNIIDSEQIDIVHCHNPVGGVNARIASKRSLKDPYVIYTAHGLHFYKGAPLRNWLFFYPVEKFLARYTDEIVAINKEDYNFIKRHFTLKKGGHVDMIHGVGINIDKFSAKPEIASGKREELKIPDGAFHIVTAAELNKNKNQAAIIEAISRIDNDKIYYSLCGKGENEEQLKQLIREKSLERRVRLFGFRDDMSEILQTADVFAFPSIREGLGIAAVEALACEIPLIVSDNRGTREYAKNGENSIVCDSKDVNGFAEAIERLMTDKDLLHKLKENCRKTAEKFSIEHTGTIMRRVYANADNLIRER